MVRAGLFIGVDKTGNLQRLNDAAAGARRMYDWALSQGMADRTHAKLITDADGAKVVPDQIYDAIKAVIDGPGVDQLVVYFAGHGVNINRSEHWLLTDAPARTSAAVNVAGSVELARYCGINHVVIISDACRVAPEGIQAQNVRGVDVFPNDGAGDRAKPVDQFFACLLGKTAAEIKDPAVAASNFSALYTNALLDALKGTRADILEPADESADASLYIRPRKLASYLESEVPSRVKALGLMLKVNQDPDAIITSDKAWVSRLDRATVALPRITRGPLTAAAVAPDTFSPHVARRRAGPRALGGCGRSNPPRVAHGRGTRRGNLGRGASSSGRRSESRVRSAPTTSSRSAASRHAARASSTSSRRAPRGKLLGAGGELLRIDSVDGPLASVLLRFDGGFGTVIPAIPGFIAALSFDEGELVDVAYEPSANNWRWDLYKTRAAEVRTLRALAASSSHHGRFRLDARDAIAIAQQMQYAKGIDPTMAIYAAYAYHDLQAIARIEQMSDYLRSDIGGTFFDLALLAAQIDRQLDQGRRPRRPVRASAGAGLGAARRESGEAAPEARRHPKPVRDSLWTLFDERGLDKLRQALLTMEVR